MWSMYCNWPSTVYTTIIHVKIISSVAKICYLSYLYASILMISDQHKL